ncbi:hypothetical protein C485_04785 [Natrinema altunense JCM 12890]|uniref:Uncharacterized protein n=1 Tax=Natrinema altunense (strain JCM 12890 / CGMCC 1.3731 / AJ2) TaxID=1227494 RepID=L9ZTI7_NATA2|nr:hypothetical protein C485_04785 [Natrinema altunense JCM 12890]
MSGRQAGRRVGHATGSRRERRSPRDGGVSSSPTGVPVARGGVRRRWAEHASIIGGIDACADVIELAVALE